MTFFMLLLNMSLRRHLLTMFIGMATTACADVASAGDSTKRLPEFYTLSGTVTDTKHNIIAGATINISCQKPASIHSDGNGDSSSWRGVTDDKGAFQSAHRLRGNCRLAVSATGFQSAVVKTDLISNSSNVDIVLHRIKGK
jgi:hypothetical protein